MVFPWRGTRGPKELGNFLSRTGTAPPILSPSLLIHLPTPPQTHTYTVSISFPDLSLFPLMLDNSLPASENNSSGVWLADNPTYNQNHAGQICVTASQSLPIHLSLLRTLGWKKTFSEQSKSTKHAWVYTSHIQTHAYTPSLALYGDYVCVYLPRTQPNIFQWQFDLHLSNGCVSFWISK